MQCQPVLFFLRWDGGECVSMWCGLGMSRALLSEACERDESCRCLPSGLGTSTTECVLWEGCVLGGLVLIRLQRKVLWKWNAP